MNRQSAATCKMPPREAISASTSAFTLGSRLMVRRGRRARTQRIADMELADGIM